MGVDFDGVNRHWMNFSNTVMVKSLKKMVLMHGSQLLSYMPTYEIGISTLFIAVYLERIRYLIIVLITVNIAKT